MSKTSSLGVIGNPVEHSLSPLIHTQFAQQFADRIDYQKYQIIPEQLAEFIQSFFKQGGSGLNVTLPYKQAVIDCLDFISDEAKLAGSVNCISVKQSGKLFGDTTDGVGLMLDLNRQEFVVNQKNILIVGAGGAAQSILVSLLNAGAKVFLVNRNEEKAKNLIHRFKHIGEISLLKNHPRQSQLIADGLISCISEFNPAIFETLTANLNQDSFCYDLNYAARACQFLDFAKQAGCRRSSDGLGMLLGQAAKSYQIWFGRLPDITKVEFDSVD